MRLKHRAIVWSVLFWGNAPILYFYWWLFAWGFDLPGRRPFPFGLGNSAVSLVFNFLIFSAFAVVHSLLAALRVKGLLAWFLDPAFYRGLYCVISGLTLTGVMLLWRPVDVILFELTYPALRAAAGCAYVSCIAGILAVSNHFDLGEFLGVKQIVRYVRNEPPRPMEFRVAGPFAWCRHPIYLLTLVGVWMTPKLTADRLEMNLLVCVYTVIGARFEERKMKREIGAPFENYCRSVPMLLPRRPRPDFAVERRIDRK